MNIFQKHKVLIALFFVANILFIDWFLDAFYDVKGFGRVTLSENDFQELVAFSAMTAFAFSVFMNLLVEVFVLKRRTVRRIADDEAGTDENGEKAYGVMAFVKAYWVYIFIVLTCPFMIFHTLGVVG